MAKLGKIKAVPDQTTSFADLKILAAIAGVYTANVAPDENFESIPDVENFKENNQIYAAAKCSKDAT